MVRLKILLTPGIELALDIPATLAGGQYVTNIASPFHLMDSFSIVAADLLMLGFGAFAGYLPVRRVRA